MCTKLKEDIKVFIKKDPACNNILEVFLCHSGFHAIFIYRITHEIWRLPLGPFKSINKFIAKLITQFAKILTGIEIHPGAQIDAGFFIDHGFGVVIGETTIIGKNVSLYQGVTLGGVSLKKEKRHPTLGNNIVVGAGAKVLGNINIGDYVQIGANSVVLKDIPEHCTVVGIPGRIVKTNGQSHSAIENLEHNKTPDPVAAALSVLNEKIEKLERLQQEVIEATGCKAKVEALENAELQKHPQSEFDKKLHEQESKESACFFGDNI